VIVKHLGMTEYGAAYDAMRRFTEGRDAAAADELWLTEHPSVYTVGMAAREAHFPRGEHAGVRDIPLVRTDRGGQITYHGPGQAIVYVLLDLSRMRVSVRALVALLEEAVIEVLAGYNVLAMRQPGAPGVYIDGAKIAALGLRVRRGCCYHGLALNVDMDLSPFHAIDPCGYPGLKVTQLRELGIAEGVGTASAKLARAVVQRLDARA
jgi:lipoyl(octanoyl) transferase